MKFLAALLLVVASVHSNSLNFYGWAPGQEFIFHYQSQVLNGIPEISQSHWSGIKMNAKVHIQSYSDHTMRFRVAEPEFFTINGENVKLSEETGRVLREQESSEAIKVESLTEEFKRYLLEPVLVHMKSGVVESFLVSKMEPTSVTNIKKAILSQIQMDVAGTRRTMIESNHIEMPISEEGWLSYFTTMEESVQGECLTEYTINKLPQFRINELEEAWRMEELKVKDFNVESESEAKTVCEGKPYYLITKTKNFEQCKRTPFFQMITRDSIANSDISKPNELLTVISTTNTFVCGELKEFVVRKVSHKRIAENSITGYNTEEKSVSPSQVTMSLLKVEPISARLPTLVPSITRVVKSLIFEFPRNEGRLAGEPSQEVIERSEEILGMRPILPMPTLTEAPHNVLIDLNKEEIMPKIHEHIKQMARLAYESPESCTSKSDLAGTVNTLAMYMRSLNLAELEKLESGVKESQPTGCLFTCAEPKLIKSMEKIFYDVLSFVGTNPSTMLVVKKVKEGSLPVSLLTKMVSMSIRNVRYPTEELMEELVQMLKSTTVKSNKQLFTSSMLQLSNLFFHAYVNPTSMVNNFPVKVFGVFGTKESTVLTEKFIPFLVEEIERTESGHVLLSASLALGKTGHLKGLKTLVKEIEQASHEIPSATRGTLIEARRSIATYALKRMAKMNPTEIRPILMSIIVNPVECVEVRIAAVSILPFAQPTTAELQKLAIRSWMESSEQVASFIISTIRSLAYTQVPELKTVGLKARTLLPLIKGEQFGIQYSHNVHFSSFVEYMRTLINNKFELVNSKSSIIPNKLSMKTVYYGPSNAFKVPAIEFSAYTYGMDVLLENYFFFFTNEQLPTSTIRTQLNKITEELKLKTRELSAPFTFLHGSWAGIESTLFLDGEIVLESLEKLATKFESGLEMEFNHVGATQVFEASDMYVTETGFPVMSISTLPIVYSVKGSIKVAGMEGMMIPKVSAKVVPVLNGKVQTTFGVITPFTKELIGTNVDMSLHSSIPVEIEGKMSRGEIELSIRTPSESERSGRQTESLHAFIKPYTFKYNFLQVAPITHSTVLKTISSGLKRQPIEMEIGQSLGLSGKLRYESDAMFTDLVSYIQKITQHTPLSIIPSGLFPSSVRMSSLKIDYFPTRSQTKEFNIVLRLSTKGMMHSLSKTQITEHQISSELSHVRSVLSQLEKANIVEIIGMTKSSSGSPLKQITSAIVLGKKSEGTHIASLEVAGCLFTCAQNELPIDPVSQGLTTKSYALSFEGKFNLPELRNRFSIEKILEEPLRGTVEAQLSFGESTDMKHVKVNAELEKTEELKREIRESPEFKECMADERQQVLLTPICTIVRSQAASLDKIYLTIETPKTWARSSFMTLLDSVSKALILGNVESEEISTGHEGVVLVEARAERTANLVTIAKVQTPSRKIVLKNLRLMGLTQSVFPATRLYSPLEVATIKMTGNQMPPTCRVEPTFFTTFDNKTVEYKINDCEHVLLMDGSKTIPMAVTTRTIESDKKMVKILSGISEIEITPTSSGELRSFRIVVNGEGLRLGSIRVGEKLIKKNKEGKTLAIVQRFEDNVISVIVPEGLKVVTDGSRVEIVASYLLKSRSVGLCGDMNGEQSADIKTPRMCVMRPDLAAISYMLNKSGSTSGFKQCSGLSGLPSGLKEEFMRESTTCPRETIIPTPISKLYETISVLNKPAGMTHIVDKQSTKLCISKQMVKTCLSKPLSIKQKSVEFACVSNPSTLARSLEKRALSGESLFQEISQLPTVFRKVEFEPVACKSEMSSISL